MRSISARNLVSSLDIKNLTQDLEKWMSDELKALEKEAEELRQNLWIWKGIAFVLLVLYVSEIGGWFS